MKIGKAHISPTHPCYIIAEAGVNHNGQLDLALELVKQAKATGADCVKFQTFKAAAVVIKRLFCYNAPLIIHQKSRTLI